MMMIGGGGKPKTMFNERTRFDVFSTSNLNFSCLLTNGTEWTPARDATITTRTLSETVAFSQPATSPSVQQPPAAEQTETSVLTCVFPPACLMIDLRHILPVQTAATAQAETTDSTIVTTIKERFYQ